MMHGQTKIKFKCR